MGFRIAAFSTKSYTKSLVMGATVRIVEEIVRQLYLSLSTIKSLNRKVKISLCMMLLNNLRGWTQLRTMSDKLLSKIGRILHSVSLQ